MNKTYSDVIAKNPSAYTLGQALSCVGIGWREIVEDLYGYFTSLYDNYGVIVYADQVKEKFGALRVYYTIDTSKQRRGYDVDLIHQTVLAVENESFSICEDCGKRGSQKKIFGWIKTLCAECYIETVGNDV